MNVIGVDCVKIALFLRWFFARKFVFKHLHGCEVSNLVLITKDILTRKNDFLLSFFKHETVQIGQLLLVTFSINRFLGF